MPGQIILAEALLIHDERAKVHIIQARRHGAIPPVECSGDDCFRFYFLRGIRVVNYDAVVGKYRFRKKVVLSFNLDVIDRDRFAAMMGNSGDFSNSPKW